MSAARFESRLRARREPCVVVCAEESLESRRARANANAGDAGEEDADEDLSSVRLVDLLRARARVDGLECALRADAENPTRALPLTALGVRFVSERGATGATGEDARARGRVVVSAEAFDATTPASRDATWARRASADECASRAREEAETSARFERFFEANERALAFNECEAFDHPLGAILCANASTKSTYEDVLASFEEMKRRFLRLPVFDRGGADPETCFGKVLVWDARAGGSTREAAEALLKSVRQTGAWDCELLVVNSDAEGRGACGVDWDACREELVSRADGGDAETSASEGRYLSADDVEGVGSYVRTFVTKTLVPHMERKLFALSTQIYNTRKGLRNQFKSFWGRSTSTTTRETGHGHSSPESQIRLAGDLAYMVGDFDTALANFKLVHSDYKSQNALKRLASSYEAMAHVYLAMRHSRAVGEVKKDIDHAYNSAMSNLQKLEATVGQGDEQRSHIEMLKTRSAVEHAEALSVLGAHRDAHVPLVLASAFHASDLRSALLLERAAFAFIRGESAMIHKFASYMVLAGARYVRAGAFPAATRCYAFALPPTADDASWNAAQEHLNTTLGRLVANAGHTRTAMEFYREAMRRATHLPADAQKTRFDALVEYVQKYENECASEKRDVREDEIACPLPKMNANKVRVTFADDRKSTESSSDNGKEAWSAIERGGVIPQNLLTSSSKPNWLSGGGRQVEVDQTAVCALGEDLKVDVELSNPLRYALELKDVRLLWEFTSASSATTSNDVVETTNDSLVRAEAVRKTLDARSTETFTLSITPRASGVLRVKGVAWTVGEKGILRGRQYFDVPAPRTRRGANGEWLRDVRKHQRLIFNVCETVPRCEGTLERVPGEAMDGSMHRVDLVITNVTQPMAKHIRVRVPKALFRPVDPSHAPVAEPTIRRNASRDNLDDAQDVAGSNDDGVIDPAGAVYALPAWETLASGSTIRWPLWFHPSAVVRAPVRVCVCYQPEPPAPKLLRYRTIRIFESVDVTPSVRVTARTIPSPSHPLARIVRLTVSSEPNQTKTFRLNGVRLGRTKPRETYTLMPLMKNANEPRVIRPGETIETLIKCSPAETSNETLNFAGDAREDVIEPLFDFHNACKGKKATAAHDDVTADGLMVTWSIEGEDVVGAHHARDVVELARCTDTARTPASLRSKISWTMDHPSELRLDELAPGNVTYASVTLNVRNESDEYLDVVFAADAASSAPANVERGGWALEHDKNAWHTRESLTTMDENRRRPIPLPPGKPFVWVGPVRRAAKNVAPGAVIRFPLTVACFAKGDHILDGYTLEWTERASSTPTTPRSSRRASSVDAAAAAPRSRANRVAVAADAHTAPFVLTVT